MHIFIRLVHLLMCMYVAALSFYLCLFIFIYMYTIQPYITFSQCFLPPPPQFPPYFFLSQNPLDKVMLYKYYNLYLTFPVTIIFLFFFFLLEFIISFLLPLSILSPVCLNYTSYISMKITLED